MPHCARITSDGREMTARFMIKPGEPYVEIWAVPKDEKQCHHLQIRATYAMLEAGKVPEASVLKILDVDSLIAIIDYYGGYSVKFKPGDQCPSCGETARPEWNRLH
jgi:hypothetical protein